MAIDASQSRLQQTIRAPYNFATTPTMDLDYGALSFYFDAFMVGVSGDIVIDTGIQTGVTIPVLAGVEYPIMVKKIYTAGTTATGIIVLKHQ